MRRVRLVIPIRFSDHVEDFPPNPFNPQCDLPFVHGFQNCEPLDAQNRAWTPSGIPTVFAVSNPINDFGKLRCESGRQLWTFRPLWCLSSSRHLRFLLHCVSSPTSDAEFNLSAVERSLAGIRVTEGDKVE